MHHCSPSWNVFSWICTPKQGSSAIWNPSSQPVHVSCETVKIGDHVSVLKKYRNRQYSVKQPKAHYFPQTRTAKSRIKMSGYPPTKNQERFRAHLLQQKFHVNSNRNNNKASKLGIWTWKTWQKYHEPCERISYACITRLISEARVWRRCDFAGR